MVQNAETLAHVALIARFGEDTGTVLVTVAGAIARPGVLELETTSTVGDAITLAGGASEAPRAILLGGYFGAWLDVEPAWSLPLDPARLRERGLSLGCGVIGVQPQSRCVVCETAGILRYLARESSAQCGPCFFGLNALSDACSRIAASGTNADDLRRRFGAYFDLVDERKAGPIGRADSFVLYHLHRRDAAATLAGDADRSPERLRLIERPKHVVGDVGPRDEDAAADVLVVAAAAPGGRAAVPRERAAEYAREAVH